MVRVANEHEGAETLYVAEGAVARRITYRGDAARAALLVAMLEEEDVSIASETQYDLDTDLNEVLVEVVAIGTAAGITSGVERFRGRTWHANVKIEPDGGDLPDDQQ